MSTVDNSQDRLELTPTGDTTPSPPTLSFAAPVDRAAVRRSSCLDVYVTDEVVSGNTYWYAAQLPRTHFYYGDGHFSSLYDPLLLHEVVRQCILLLTTRHLAKASTDKTVADSAQFTLHKIDSLTVGHDPARLVLRVEPTPAGRCRAHFAIRGELDGVFAFDYEFTGGWLSAGGYARLRSLGGTLAPAETTTPVVPANPESVGRVRPGNVLIGNVHADGDGDHAMVVPDHTHASLFDQSPDHLPATVLLEVARQIVLNAALRRNALAPSRAVLTHWDARFHRFADVDKATTIHTVTEAPFFHIIRGDGTVTVVRAQVTMHQAGDQVASVALAVTYPHLGT